MVIQESKMKLPLNLRLQTTSTNIAPHRTCSLENDFINLFLEKLKNSHWALFVAKKYFYEKTFFGVWHVQKITYIYIYNHIKL